MKSGIYPGISNKYYHASEGFSSTLIKKMSVPAIAKHHMDNPPEFKDCFRIGTAIHTYILEPSTFYDEFLTGISVGRRGKADREEWSQWFFEHGADGDHIVSHKASEWNGMFEAETGKRMVTPDEIDAIKMMAASVQANPDAMKLLDGGIAEASCYWQDEETGLHLKCRPDYLSGFVSDLKSCASALPHMVSRTMHQHGYHISQAVYLDGIMHATGQYREFVFIFIEKTAPYLCACYRLDDESAELGYRQYRANLLRLAECLNTDKWPGLENNYALSLPGYAFKDEEEEYL